jgi:hypothetical protein
MVEPQASTLSSLRIKVHRGPGSVANAVRSTCGCDTGDLTRCRGFDPIYQN